MWLALLTDTWGRTETQQESHRALRDVGMVYGVQATWPQSALPAPCVHWHRPQGAERGTSLQAAAEQQAELLTNLQGTSPPGPGPGAAL